MNVALRRLIASVDNGVWGSEPGESQLDVRCIRAADFDFPGLRVDMSHAPLRGVDRASFARLALRRGDIVLEKSGGGDSTPVGRAVAYEDDQPAVTSNFAARVRAAAGVDPRFLVYLLQSLYTSGITLKCIKQTTGIQNLDTAHWLESRVERPEYGEQRRIADFLDDRIARIDRIITSRRTQIHLLSTWVESAVEGAFSPEVSAGRWLRVKDVASKVGSGKTPRGGADAYVAEGVAFLRSQNVHNDGLRLDDVAFISPETDQEMSGTRVMAGDVLLNITGGSLGRCCVTDATALPANVSQHVCIIRPHAIEPRNLAMVLRSRIVQDQIRLAQVGGNRDGLNFEQVRELRFWHPEDSSVWSRCRSLEARWGRGLGIAGRTVSSLTEYKQSLITAAVTGGLDVTTAGSSIPG